MKRIRSTFTPASRAARWFWPMAVTERPNTVRASTTCMPAASRTTSTASTGTPITLVVAKSPRAVGGLIRSPRFHQIAVDCTMKLDDSVAMIGGILSSRISPKLSTPTPSPK